MTQAKAKYLKDTMCQQFREVFNLCQFVMENSNNVTLIQCTLETLLRFLNWIPLGYIFETGLINALIYKVNQSKIKLLNFSDCFLSLQFLIVPMFRNVTLKCLTEIASVNASSYDEMFLMMFSSTMAQLEVVIYSLKKNKILYFTNLILYISDVAFHHKY